MLQGNIDGNWALYTTWFSADSAEDALEKGNTILLTRLLTYLSSSGSSCWYLMHMNGQVPQLQAMKMDR